MDIPDRSITVSFEPNTTDIKLLARRVKRQRLRDFVRTQAGTLFVAWMVGRWAHNWPPLHMIPQWAISITVFALTIALYFWGTILVLRRSTASESSTRSVHISKDGLVVETGDDSPGLFYPLPGIDVKNTPDGVYIDRRRDWLLIPARAFADSADAAIFEEIFLHAKRAGDMVRIPHGRIEGFPWTITFQQSKGDAIHAYYHGWGRSFLWSSDGREAMAYCLLPLVMCVIIGSILGSSIGSGLLVGVVISVLFTIVTLFYLASPAFPVNVVNKRRPITQPLTAGLGPEGVALDNGLLVQSIPWDEIRKIAADRRLIYLETRSRDLILIPRAVFLDAAQAEEFLAAAQAYRRGETPVKSESAASWPPSVRL